MRTTVWSAACAAVLLAGCGDGAGWMLISDRPRGVGDPVAFVRVEGIPQSGAVLPEPGRNVIRTVADWELAWSRLWGDRIDRPQAPPVDFASEVVLLVTMAGQNTHGFEIRVERLERRSDHTAAHVLEISPGIACPRNLTPASPADAVRIPRTALPLRMVEARSTREC
jgi:hypothetical protein